jgi:hypothetical protein
MKNKIDAKWVSWAKQQVTLLKDGGYLIYPMGAIFQVNKGSRTLDLICCKPEWINSEDEKTNTKVFAAIEYRYVRSDNVPTDVDSIIDNIFAKLQKYVSDLPALLHGIAVIFGLKDETDRSDAKIMNILAKKGKKLPLNPVTIHGKGSLTLGRLWVGADIVPDTAHRFNPEIKRGPRWDKPFTLVLWQTDAKGMVVDEEDFIDVANRLGKDDKINLKMWGRQHRLSEDKMFVVFVRNPDGTMLVSMHNEKEEVGTASLNFAKFMDGLGHLFPNGELLC